MKKGLKQRDGMKSRLTTVGPSLKSWGNSCRDLRPCSALDPASASTDRQEWPKILPVYNQSREVARQLSERGYGVITGGGPGVMEAGNRGAHDVGGTSVGLNIELPFEQHNNPYIDPDKSIDFDYFFVRKVCL